MVTKIWYGKGLINIKPDSPVKSTRLMTSFCSYNSLKNAVVKTQGGWYFVNQDGRLEFVTRTLGDISFQQLYDFLKDK